MTLRRKETDMPQEKKLWLESIGAKKFPSPVSYTYTFPGYNGAFHLSEEYVRKTPIKELKDQYTRNEEHVKLCLNGKKKGERTCQD